MFSHVSLEISTGSGDPIKGEERKGRGGEGRKWKGKGRREKRGNDGERKGRRGKEKRRGKGEGGKGEKEGEERKGEGLMASLGPLGLESKNRGRDEN